MHILLPWPELRLFAPHLKFKLDSTYQCEFSSRAHDSSDRTFKNLLYQQSIRLSLSSLLYTGKILLLRSTWSGSKFGLHSLVLSCSRTHSYTSCGDCITGYWHGELSRLHRHLKITVHCRKNIKATQQGLCCPWALCFHGDLKWYTSQPQPTAMVLLGLLLLLLTGTGTSLTPQGARSGAPPAHPTEKWTPSWTGSPGCLVRAGADSAANCHWQA